MRFASLRSWFLISVILCGLIAVEVTAVVSSLHQIKHASHSPDATPAWIYVLLLAAMPSGTLPTLACLAVACWAFLHRSNRVPFLIAGLAVLDYLSTAVSLCGRALSGFMTYGGLFGLGAAYSYGAIATLALLISICLTVILILCCAIRAKRIGPAVAEVPIVGTEFQLFRRLLRSAAICFFFYLIILALFSTYGSWAGGRVDAEIHAAPRYPGFAARLGVASGLLLIVEGIWPSPVVIAASGASAEKWRLALIVCGSGAFAAFGDSCLVFSGAMRDWYFTRWVWCEAAVYFAAAYMAVAVILAMKANSMVNRWGARQL